jgi:hypothetical protein
MFLFFHRRFQQSVPHTIHHLCVSQFSLLSVMLSHGYVAIKEKYECPSFVYTDSQIYCETYQQWRCTVLTVGNFHIECSICLRDLSHRVPTIAILVLSDSCAVRSFNDTHTLTQILLPTVEQ